jgi:hypothetical protein
VPPGASAAEHSNKRCAARGSRMTGNSAQDVQTQTQAHTNQPAHNTAVGASRHTYTCTHTDLPRLAYTPTCTHMHMHTHTYTHRAPDNVWPVAAQRVAARKHTTGQRHCAVALRSTQLPPPQQLMRGARSGGANGAVSSSAHAMRSFSGVAGASRLNQPARACVCVHVRVCLCARERGHTHGGEDKQPRRTCL